MNESYRPNNAESYKVETLKLKDKNTEELYTSLVDISHDWTFDQQQQMTFAYDLIVKAHASDRHKNRPYTEHLLRVANRLAHYMDVKDPDVIIAGMLHDIVEDHPLEMINGSLVTNDGAPVFGMENMDTIDPKQQQTIALSHISVLFSEQAATTVAAVTNPPQSEAPANYSDKLQAYTDKVATAIQSPQAWLVKFSDWCDNGLGVNYDVEGQGAKHKHFRRKYGMVLPILRARFEQDDIQTMLSDKAKRYVIQQFSLGEERLAPVA
ncbi:MAG TPA: hypothetical protein VFM68_01225 [Candidatus Saccharimonadales bacterium]|nr:hypothetical protein [Candidatus Saccharimonadales bacterium]